MTSETRAREFPDGSSSDARKSCPARSGTKVIASTDEFSARLGTGIRSGEEVRGRMVRVIGMVIAATSLGK